MFFSPKQVKWIKRQYRQEGKYVNVIRGCTFPLGPIKYVIFRISYKSVITSNYVFFLSIVQKIKIKVCSFLKKLTWKSPDSNVKGPTVKSHMLFCVFTLTSSRG